MSTDTATGGLWERLANYDKERYKLNLQWVLVGSAHNVTGPIFDNEETAMQWLEEVELTVTKANTPTGQPSLYDVHTGDGESYGYLAEVLKLSERK